MPRFLILDVEFDQRNEHATRRASEAQIRSILTGQIQASPNKKSGTADYLFAGVADDGSSWTVIFDYDSDTQTARPITAFPSRKGAV